MTILELRAAMDKIVGEPRRKQFFKWLVEGSGNKYLMYSATEAQARDLAEALTAVGMCAGFHPSPNYPQQYTVWISA